jgi:hypothetical protein
MNETTIAQPTRPDQPNALAGPLKATILELASTRAELQAVKLVSACQRDFAAWLQADLCRARKWTTVDVVRAWHEELDRREQARRIVRDDHERRAA